MAFNYRVAERTKRHFIDFFQRIFTLYSENKLQFSDEYNKIGFGQPPKCSAVDTYDFKYYPIVLVGVGTTNLKDCAINKFRSYYEDDAGIVSATYGGFANITLNFNIRARSTDERNNLADTIMMYLNAYDTKKTFGVTYGIRVIGGPSYNGESVEDDPQTNVKVFTTSISQVIETDYEEGIDIVDSFGNVGLKVEELISYLQPDVHDFIKVAKDLSKTDPQIITDLINNYNVSSIEAQVWLDKYYANTLKVLNY